MTNSQDAPPPATSDDAAPQPGMSYERKQSIYAWLMSAPALLGLLLFLVLPFVLAIGLSFTDQRFLSPNPTDFVGLRNYDRLLTMTTLVQDAKTDEAGNPIRVGETDFEFPEARPILRDEENHPEYQGFYEWFRFNVYGDIPDALWGGPQRVIVLAKDPVFLRSLVNNFVFAAVVVPGQSALALFLAVLVNQALRGINVFRTIYFSPVVTAMVVISVVWTFLYQPDGLINQFLTWISGGYIGPYKWLRNPSLALPAIMIMSIWQGVGFQMVIFLAGLQGIPEVLYESAQIDGANRWERFWDITIPQLRNTIIFVAISTTILAFRLFVQVDVMTSGGPLNSTSTVVFYAVEKGFRENNIAYASAISVIFFIIVLLVSLAQRRLLQRRT